MGAQIFYPYTLHAISAKRWRQPSQGYSTAAFQNGGNKKKLEFFTVFPKLQKQSYPAGGTFNHDQKMLCVVRFIFPSK